MKRVVSISIGSSKRDHAVELELLGERFRVERVGTDGDVKKAVALVSELDGKVAAFGMGGIDLDFKVGKRAYPLRSAKPIRRAAKLTPMVDGGGLKDSVERWIILELESKYGIPIKGKRALIPAACARMGMAEALDEAGAQCTYGDLVFALGLPFPLKSMRALQRIVSIIGPIVAQLPISMLYPTGDKQGKASNKYAHFYRDHDIIAGDFHYVFQYMPEDMSGKVIITNTVTQADVDELRRRRVGVLVTTTPNLGGRSFGTNVIEGLIVALTGKQPAELTKDDYVRIMQEVNFQPRIERFSG